MLFSTFSSNEVLFPDDKSDEEDDDESDWNFNNVPFSRTDSQAGRVRYPSNPPSLVGTDDPCDIRSLVWNTVTYTKVLFSIPQEDNGKLSSVAAVDRRMQSDMASATTGDKDRVIRKTGKKVCTGWVRVC